METVFGEEVDSLNIYRPKNGDFKVIIREKELDAALECRSCGGRHLELVLDLGLQPWGNHYVPIQDHIEHPRFPLELYFCHDCAMVQIGFTIPKEFMFVDHNYVSGTTKSLIAHFEQVAAKILKRVDFKETDYILDIGGNDGTFLKSFKREGYGVLNVDSGIKQAELSNAIGIPCINDFFNEKLCKEILTTHGKAKVIHGSGILFHLEELHSVFAGIKSLLDEDGLLVAEFIYLPEMINNNAYDQIYHEHLLYYSLKSFNSLLNKYELEIYDAEIVPIHGGSCIAYIGHSGRNALSEQFKQLINAENINCSDKVEVYKEFAKRVVLMREELRKMVFSLRQQGKSIQALGAPVKGSTIINYCNFTKNEIDCAVEINDLKCNCYMPGTLIPVYHQDNVPPPDVYLLLSWNFKTEILSKLAHYQNSGGKILLPIPQPELI